MNNKVILCQHLHVGFCVWPIHVEYGRGSSTYQNQASPKLMMFKVKSVKSIKTKT